MEILAVASTCAARCRDVPSPSTTPFAVHGDGGTSPRRAERSACLIREKATHLGSETLKSVRRIRAAQTGCAIGGGEPSEETSRRPRGLQKVSWTGWERLYALRRNVGSGVTG